MSGTETTGTDEQIAAFRSECQAVRNFPLARLCSEALTGTGDAEARTRVLAIISGKPDPGSAASRARVAELRASLGLPAAEEA